MTSPENNSFTEKEMNIIFKTVGRFPRGTEVSIAKIQGGAAQFYGGEVNADKTVAGKVNAGSVFEIGSISKVFTSALLAQHVNEGRVSLDDNISNHLGFQLNKGADISLLELSNHTSGLSRLPPSMFWKAIFGSAENPYKDYDVAALENDLKTRIKLKKKGKMRYSNFGVGLLGHIMAKLEDASYEEALQKRIFGPLSMKRSGISRAPLKEYLVKGRTKKGSIATNWDLAALEGAGAILSSVDDMAKFTMSNFNKNNAAYQLQQTPTAKVDFIDRICLGWMLQKFKTTNDREWHWHNGGTGGYSSAMVMDVERQTGVVILSNLSGLFLFKSQEITHLAFNLHKEIQKS